MNANEWLLENAPDYVLNHVRKISEELSRANDILIELAWDKQADGPNDSPMADLMQQAADFLNSTLFADF